MGVPPKLARLSATNSNAIEDSVWGIPSPSNTSTLETAMGTKKSLGTIGNGGTNRATETGGLWLEENRNQPSPIIAEKISCL